MKSSQEEICGAYRTMAFQQVSLPEHDRTWPWWWCFLSVPVLDEESEAPS